MLATSELSKAFIINTGGGIAIADRDKWPLSMDEGVGFDWPAESVVEPHDPTHPPFGGIQCLREHPGTREEFADAVSSGRSVVYIQAFIEYESHGTVWHRDIGYIWIPTDQKRS